VVTGYALAFGSLLLVGGRLGDIYSRKGLLAMAGARQLLEAMPRHKTAHAALLTGAIRAVCVGETLLARRHPPPDRRLLPRPGTRHPGRQGPRRPERAGTRGRDRVHALPRRGNHQSHITRILARLGLRDRVQIAVFAYENGIVRPGHPS
jgi:hypothetical protein